MCIQIYDNFFGGWFRYDDWHVAVDICESGLCLVTQPWNTLDHAVDELDGHENGDPEQNAFGKEVQQIPMPKDQDESRVNPEVEVLPLGSQFPHRPIV